MNYKNLKSYFLFTKSQRIGILALFVLIIVVQAALYFITNYKPTVAVQDKKQWLAVQAEMDSLKLQIPPAPKIYPFNPNFITDHKGYKLGMSVEEIDRLLKFRKTNKYVNSAVEFQAVTKVSDSLLNAISLYFKFPDWVTNKKNYKRTNKTDFSKKEKINILDINYATAEDLIKVYGIGPALSERILKQKEMLGGFVTMDQMNDVWGLSPEVVANLKKSFQIGELPNVKKVNINQASLKELSQFPYFRYPLSKAIITYRSMNGDIRNIEDLAKVPNFPLEKIDRIAVYLEF